MMDAAWLSSWAAFPHQAMAADTQIIAQAAGRKNDFADFAETAGSGFAFTRSLAGTRMKG